MQHSIQKIAGIVAWLAVVVMIGGMGLRWIALPESAGLEYGMRFDGPMALNQARGDIGGAFLGLGIVTALGLRRREPLLLEAVAIAIAGVIVGRCVGLLFDGVAPLAALFVGIETTGVASLLVTARAMRGGPSDSPRPPVGGRDATRPAES